jgi:Uma2 family endonuclease
MAIPHTLVVEETVPILENGDRLTRPEFERRYEAMPHVKKAELIEGIVYMPSPVRIDRHAEPHAAIAKWLGDYWLATPGVQLGLEPSVRLDLDNEPQPDAMLRIVEGGSSWIDEDNYIQGAPELLVEVAASSVSKDMHGKLRAYQRNGVQEYLVWQVDERRVVWLALQHGQYAPLVADEQGVVRSQVFPGLWLDTAALVRGDFPTVIQTLQQGLLSDEYDAFKRRLADTPK